MTSVARFARFNVVGAAGVVVQLASLALLTHVAGWNYLPATVLAVSMTLIHNFAWHIHWTWRDRRITGRRITVALARFVGGNGIVSLAGNIALMPVLAGLADLPVVLANVIAIAVCALVNFALADKLCFALTGPEGPRVHGCAGAEVL